MLNWSEAVAVCLGVRRRPLGLVRPSAAGGYAVFERWLDGLLAAVRVYERGAARDPTEEANGNSLTSAFCPPNRSDSSAAQRIPSCIAMSSARQSVKDDHVREVPDEHDRTAEPCGRQDGGQRKR